MNMGSQRRIADQIALDDFNLSWHRFKSVNTTILACGCGKGQRCVTKTGAEVQYPVTRSYRDTNAVSLKDILLLEKICPDVQRPRFDGHAFNLEQFGAERGIIAFAHNNGAGICLRFERIVAIRRKIDVAGPKRTIGENAAQKVSRLLINKQRHGLL